MSRSPMPQNICVPPQEWDKLDPTSRQFLIEAEAGGLRYIAEKGEVLAWGPAYEGLFSMDIKTEPHSEDGFLITLPDHDS